jgi:hypothetical protein
MPRLKHQSPKDELIYRMWQFVRGRHPYGLAEAKLRYSVLRALAKHYNVSWPGEEDVKEADIAPGPMPVTPDLKPEDVIPKTVRNIRTELEGRV